MREEENSPRALQAQVGKEAPFAKNAWKMPETVFNNGHCLIHEITSTSLGNCDAESGWNAGKDKVEVSDIDRCTSPGSTSPGRCVAESGWNAGKDKAIIHKYQKSALTLFVAIVIATSTVVVISLAVYSTKPCLPCFPTVSAACPDFWIGYRGKCFYVSKEESNWSLSLKTCSSFNASLAVIDTQKELDFWVEILHPLHYWFGLSRKIKHVWEWYNGTEFKNQFAVRGEGFCAYVDGKGASSTICSMEKRFLCSRPESCSIKRREPLA